MKTFELKLPLAGLAAAVSLMFTGPAAATINSGANGDLFLSVWNTKGTEDAADDTSYTLDLGVNLNSWASAANPPVLGGPATSLSFTLPSFSSFLGSAAADDIFWNIAALDSSGPRRALTTGGAAPAPSNLQLTTAIGKGEIYLSAVNGLGNHGTQDAGFNTATSADGNAFANGPAWGDNFGAGLPGFSNSANLGESLSFFLISTQGTNVNAITAARVNQFTNDFGPGQWTLTANGLSYTVAAVPEPGAWAMFAAGLLAVGAIARRRVAV